MGKELLRLRDDRQEFKKWRDLYDEITARTKIKPSSNYAFTLSGILEHFEDIEIITSMYLREGQNIVEIFGWALPAIPSFIKSKIGKQGQLYLVSADSELKEELFSNFLSMIKSKRRIERGLEPDSHFQNKGTPLKYIKNRGYIKFLEREFENLGGEDYLEKVIKPWHVFRRGEVKERLIQDAETFFERQNIIPIEKVLPPYPSQISEASIDVIIEHEGFGFIEEELIEGIIVDSDRILKPGGYLIFYEGPRQQVAVMYYGEERFSERYEREIINSLNDPYAWLVLKKKCLKN